MQQSLVSPCFHRPFLSQTHTNNNSIPPTSLLPMTDQLAIHVFACDVPGCYRTSILPVSFMVHMKHAHKREIEIPDLDAFVSEAVHQAPLVILMADNTQIEDAPMAEPFQKTEQVTPPRVKALRLTNVDDTHQEPEGLKRNRSRSDEDDHSNKRPFIDRFTPKYSDARPSYGTPHYRDREKRNESSSERNRANYERRTQYREDRSHRAEGSDRGRDYRRSEHQKSPSHNERQTSPSRDEHRMSSRDDRRTTHGHNERRVSQGHQSSSHQSSGRRHHHEGHRERY
ncbi:hypothetical protein EDC01DRAFT_492084 [Geopyxis carbonaria]|nr:hypothetical protein EDC01DRAFT_492084 [Geopyxis carbonaria]